MKNVFAGAKSGYQTRIFDKRYTVQTSGDMLQVLPDGAAGPSWELNAALDGPKRRGAGRKSAVLDIDPARGLEREISPLALPRKVMRQMANLDVQTSTPLSPDDVMLMFPVSTVGGAKSTYVAVKRPFLNSIAERLKLSGIRPTTILLNGTQNTYIADDADVRNMTGSSSSKNWLNSGLRGMVVVLLLLALSTLGHLYMRQYTAHQKISDELNVTGKKVAQIRKSMAQRKQHLIRMEALRKEKSARAPVTSVLEELAELIPDNAWLTNITIEDQQISVSGFAESASGLISVLNGSDILSDPALSGRVLRNALETGEASERFTITMKMKGNVQ